MHILHNSGVAVASMFEHGYRFCVALQRHPYMIMVLVLCGTVLCVKDNVCRGLPPAENAVKYTYFEHVLCSWQRHKAVPVGSVNLLCTNPLVLDPYDVRLSLLVCVCMRVCLCVCVCARARVCLCVAGW